MGASLEKESWVYGDGQVRHQAVKLPPTIVARHVRSDHIRWGHYVRYEHFSALLRRVTPLLDLIVVSPPLRKCAVSVNNRQPRWCWPEADVLAGGIAVRNNHVANVKHVRAHLQNAD